MPINKRSILLDTNCYVDAIVMLVDKLERKFVHIYPALQKVLYELPNINDPKAKYVEHTPIEEIIHDKETLHSLESSDYQSYSDNLRRRVPYSEIIQTLYLENYENFDWITRAIYVGFNDD